MAQASTPDYDQLESSDPSLAAEEPQGKTSLFGKLKNKTKEKKSKLRSKLRSSSKTGEDSTEATTEEVQEGSSSSASSSDEESEAPEKNAVNDVTQPEYAREMGAGEPQYDAKGSPTVPTQNFPGNFTGIADVQTEDTQDDSDLSRDFQGLSTEDKNESMETQPDESVEESSESMDVPASESRDVPASESSDVPMTQKVQDTVTSAAVQTKEKFSGTDDSSQQYTSPDSAAPVAEQAQHVGDKAAEAGKTWSQWAAEKVGYAKDTTGEKVGAAKELAAAKAPTTAEGKPVHEEAYGTALGYKDAAVQKAIEAKDAVASQIPERSSIPSDPAQQTYVQKATGGIYGATDKLFASTQPGEHDKALSQKVTETVGNLPATLASSLGFGGKTASSPTTTPGVTSDAPVSSSTDEAAGAPPQAGIVSRITGLFGAKKPATESSTPSSEMQTQTGVPES